MISHYFRTNNLNMISLVTGYCHIFPPPGRRKLHRNIQTNEDMTPYKTVLRPKEIRSFL